MKKIGTIIYIVVIVAIIGTLVALAFAYKDQVREFFGNSTNEKNMTFIAEQVKDKTFSKKSDGVNIYENEYLTLYASSRADVYAITYKDSENGNIEVEESLKSEDGYSFKYLICLNGAAGKWNLTNNTSRTQTVDVYFTVTDGAGLKIKDDLYYAKSGAINVTDTEICIYDTKGQALNLTGDKGSAKRILGMPYKVSFVLDAKQSVTLSSSTNRLALYAINFTT